MTVIAMTSTDLQYSMMKYLWSQFVPAFRARGFTRKSVLDVSSTVAETGQTAKVTIAQKMTAANLTDGATKVLTDLPPLVAEVSLTQDIYNAFGVTDLAASLIAGQPTLPAIVQGAMNGVLDAIEEVIVTSIADNVPSANTIGSSSAAMTEALAIQAGNLLVQNYMPQEAYYGLLAPTAGAWGAFSQIDRVSWAQIRGPAQNSLVIGPPDSFDYEVQYNGGLWSRSQLVQAVTVSGSSECANIVWHPMASAVAIRPPKLPTVGVGCIARNFLDAKSGIALQMSTLYNKDTLSEEMVIRTLLGVAPCQVAWSAMIVSN
jgi:hypothetical protein